MKKFNIPKGELMIRFGVCDDEKEWRELIQEQVLLLYGKFGKCDEDAECLLYSSGDELIENYEKDNLDIAFIDPLCGDSKGFDIAGKLAEGCQNIGVVYITGHDHLVYEAFESKPLGFVRKGCLYEDMERVFSFIMKYIEVHRKYVKLKGIGGEVSIPVYRIDYLEVYKHEVTVHLQDREFEVRESLANLEKELQKYDFLRINRYCIVNLKNVSKVKGQECRLENGKMLQIARDRTKIVFKHWIRCIMEI